MQIRRIIPCESLDCIELNVLITIDRDGGRQGGREGSWNFRLLNGAGWG